MLLMCPFCPHSIPCCRAISTSTSFSWFIHWFNSVSCFEPPSNPKLFTDFQKMELYLLHHISLIFDCSIFQFILFVWKINLNKIPQSHILLRSLLNFLLRSNSNTSCFVSNPRFLRFFFSPITFVSNHWAVHFFVSFSL